MDPLALLRQHEPELKQKFGVAKIGIFGSFARGEERPDSDVDVLVSFQVGKKTFDNFMGTRFYLEDLFKRKVDLVTDAALNLLSAVHPAGCCLYLIPAVVSQRFQLAKNIRSYGRSDI
jgi:predicted nucleotidyltransferase